MERRQTRLRPAAEVATIAAAIVEVMSGGCATPPPSRRARRSQKDLVGFDDKRSKLQSIWKYQGGN